MKTFEYKVVTCPRYEPSIENELQRMGREGWELVAVDEHANQTVLYFKREIADG